MGQREPRTGAKKKLNGREVYGDILTIYKRLLLETGMAPCEVDEQDAQLLFDVLGAEAKEKMQFIDEV